MKHKNPRLRFLFPCLLLIFLSACLMKDPVTGRTSFNLMSEGQEVALGRSSHDSVIQEYGLYGEDRWQSYVNDIGQEIAGISHRSHLEFHFHVVDSPVVNAFALPGGWIYFTRGILANFNSEDELAGVMGHEIGHVVARHGAEQYSKAQLAGIGLELGSAFSKNFRKYRMLAEIGTSLLFLKFSRSQESESDKLGVAYTTQLGYDSHKMADFFRTIHRISAGSGQSMPNFLSTHPNPLNRERRVHELTDQFRAERGYQARKTDREAFLRKLEGLVYGEDPREGYLEESDHTFYHPNWNIQFPVPKGWQFQRNRIQFQMVNPKQTGAVVFMKMGEYETPDKAADGFIADARASETGRKHVRMTGFRGLRLRSELGDAENRMGVVSYFISNGGELYLGHGFTKKDGFAAMEKSFDNILSDFAKITNLKATQKKPERVRIRRAPLQGTLEANLRKLGVRDNRLAELSIMNGIPLSDQVPRGGLLKIVQ